MSRHARDVPPAAESGSQWSYGIRAVETLLDQRPDEIMELWVQRGGGGARQRLRDRAASLQVKWRDVDHGNLARLLGEEANHQGVAARTQPFDYADANQLLKREGPCLILVLDGVQDPHNLGAILRSAVALGCDGVVIPERRAVGVTPTVRKVSTGAVDQIPLAQVTNLVHFLGAAKEAGFWCYGTVVDEGESIDSVAFAERTVLVMGSEGRGMRPLVKKHCDALIHLPIHGVESLNVSVACGIFLYAYRQRLASA